MTHPPSANRLPLWWVLKGSKTVSCLMQVLFRVRCSWKQPPHLQTQRRYDGFWEGSYGEYTVAFELSGLRDLRQKQWSLYPHSVTVQYRVQIPGMWIPWVCYGSEPVLLRIRDRRTTGPEDRGTRGPGDQRTAGPEDQRPRDHGPRDQGPGDHRATGLAKPPKNPTLAKPFKKKPRTREPYKYPTTGQNTIQQPFRMPQKPSQLATKPKTLNPTLNPRRQTQP